MIGVAEELVGIGTATARRKDVPPSGRPAPQHGGAPSSRQLRDMLRWTVPVTNGFLARSGAGAYSTTACGCGVSFSITHVAAYGGDLHVTLTPEPATAVGSADVRLVYATFSSGPSNFQATSALPLPEGGLKFTFRGVGQYGAFLTGIRAAAGALLVEGCPTRSVVVIPCEDRLL